MLEREEPNRDQTNQSDVSQSTGSSDQEFLALEQQQTLTNDSIPGVRSILHQFSGTPIADVFDDLPDTVTEENPITPTHLRTLVQRRLHHIQEVQVSLVSSRREEGEKNKAFRRELAKRVFNSDDYEFFDELYDWITEDEDITDEAIALARPVRETIQHLVLATQEESVDEIDVVFTPTVRDRQLILYEYRSQQMYINPAESTHVYDIEEEQYTVFTRDEWGIWQQQGVLPFRTVSEYEDSTRMLHARWDARFTELEDRRLLLEEAQGSIAKEPDNPFTRRELYTGDAQTSDFHRRYYELEQQLEAMYTEVQEHEILPLHTVTRVSPTSFDSETFNRGVHKPGEEHLVEGNCGESRGREVFAALPDVFKFSMPTSE